MIGTKNVINALMANAKLAELTRGAIHPVVARFGTDCPYIIVRTDAMEVRRSKRGYREGVTYTVAVVAVAESYEMLMQLVAEVQKLDTNIYEVNSYHESYEDPDKLVAELIISYTI